MGGYMSSETIEVTIFGRQYSVIASKDIEYIKKLAEIVDRKMKEIAEKVPDVSSTGIAVLACLNIADELMMLKEGTSKDMKAMDEIVVSLIREIDTRLSHMK